MEPNNTNPVQIQPRPQKVKIAPKRNYCLYIAVVLVILFLILIVLPITILVANGTIKSSICNTLSSSSSIYKDLNCSSSSTTQGNNPNFQQDNTISIDKSKISTQEDLIVQIVDKSSPAVVTVAASSQLNPDDIANGTVNQTEQNIGSGFIVRSDGIIITNNHVVADTTLDYSVIISTESKPIPAKSIYRDAANDIAIVKIDRTNLPTLKLGDSDSVKRGNTVVAIGSPLGDLTGSVTSGIVSGLNRDVTAGGNGTTETLQGAIQTDAAVNPGNSGGPLINSNGEVIGVNFATTQGASNISFAIPINNVKAKLVEFQNYGKLLQPFIGISFVQRTFYLTDGALTGALISQVLANSPAQTAGLQKGDIVVTADGKDLVNNSLQTIIQSKKVGDDLKLNIWRQGKRMDITVKIADRSDVPGSTSNP